MYKYYIKPFFDLLAGLLGILLTSPVLLLISLLLVLTNFGNPFFIQPRTGRNGKIFSLIKFRTMNNRKDALGNLLPDAERITSIGKIIRKTSLDEVPQLINVIKGDMSLVGPRPLLPEYKGLYNDEQLRRFLAKPGITGWAQVNGRNDISWDEKFKLDVWYIDNISFQLDMKILFMTVINVIRGKGISKNGYATTEKFNGNN